MMLIKIGVLINSKKNKYFFLFSRLRSLSSSSLGFHTILASNKPASYYDNCNCILFRRRVFAC